MDAYTVVNKVIYSRIDNVTARTGTGEVNHNNPTAIDRNAVGRIIIEPYVIINSNTLTVTEIGMFSFVYCSNITEILLPQTIKFLGRSCFNSMMSLKSIIIPSSVEVIDIYFLNGVRSTLANITFCGLTQPKLLTTSGVEIYIASEYNIPINVPINYQGDTFLKKNVVKTLLTCLNYQYILKTCNQHFSNKYISIVSIYIIILLK